MTVWSLMRVVERRIEAEDIIAFVLEPVTGSLPAYQAGAHIDVRMPSGLVRQYSLCGPLDRPDRYEIAVLRDASGRGGSRSMHADVLLDSAIEVSAPRNLFPLEGGQRRALLFAGGIGVTPILAMAEELSRAGKDFAMHYCTRRAARAAFRERIDTSPFARQVHYHFDDDPETRLDAPAALAGWKEGTHLYVCGPDGFMNHVLDLARAAGWPESHIHFERFSACVPADGGGDGFEIEIEGTGQIIAVPPGETALAALAAAGFEIPVSCEQGICGTCLTPVTGGVPDHRDMFLSDAERAANDCFTPCCSRALTPRLTLRV